MSNVTRYSFLIALPLACVQQRNRVLQCSLRTAGPHLVIGGEAGNWTPRPALLAPYATRFTAALRMRILARVTQFDPKPGTITVDARTRVSALLSAAPHARACLVLAHGAGAGMTHPFMEAVARELLVLKIATLRYQFPYMENHSRRPDPPALCHATVRAATAAAHQAMPELPLFAGGKSFGGRMTSQAQAQSPLAHVRGLVFLGFPLHPPKQPAEARAKHLFEIDLPLLFLQGTRDAFADPALLQAVIARLGNAASLRLLPDADHSYHVPARSGRNDEEVRAELTQALAEWIDGVIAAPAG
jgi:predicted alpha/beta-hydrolase family hydrolase